MNRNRLIAAAFAAALLPAAVSAQTVRVAHIDPFSGAFANVGALNGMHVEYGAALVNQSGGVLGGRQLEVIRFDNNANPQDAVVVLQEAIDQGIRIVTQATNSGIALAVQEAIVRHNRRNPDDPVLYLNYGSADPSLTRDHCDYYSFRFEVHSGMKQLAIVDAIAANPEIDSVYIIGQDYSHGHEVSRYTRAYLAERRPDIEIVGDEFHPVGRVRDFTPYIARIQASGADAVITGNFGTDLSLLIRAANEGGLTSTIYTQYASTFGAPTAIGPDGIGRVIDTAHWTPDVWLTHESEAGRQLVEDFERSYNAEIGSYQILVQMQMLGAAINAAGSDNPTEIAAALSGATFDAVTGPVMMRESDHQLLHPLFVSVFTDEGITNDSEGTGIGWRTLREIPASELTDDSTCQVSVPG